MLIRMIDGGLISIDEDREYDCGCETCDYGSSYINEIDFNLTSGTLNVKSDNMYVYAISDGELMNILLPNVQNIYEMKESEFVEWIKKEIIDNVRTDELIFEFKGKDINNGI